MALLKIENFYYSYLKNKKPALQNINFCLERGDSLGIVGESGSGKSTLLFCILGLLKKSGHLEGKIFYKGENLLLNNKFQKEVLWKQIAIVFQNREGVLNPRMTIRDQLKEVLKKDKTLNIKKRLEELFTSVKLATKWLDVYPHQLSGGMRQKVLISMAIALKPSVLLIDEPTTSLEGISKIEIMQMLQKIREKENIAIILTSHDMKVIKNFSQKVLVLYRGKIVEEGLMPQLSEKQYHPYSRGLIQSSPDINPFKDLWGIDDGDELEHHGCPYYSKCPQRILKCQKVNPPLENHGPDRKIACILGGIIDVLLAKGISHSFYVKKEEIKALDNVSIKIRMGEIVSIIGESGSGKTTLAEILVRLRNPLKGEIIFEGKSLKKHPLAQENGIQIIFQDPYSAINPTMKVFDAVGEPLIILRKKDQECKTIIKKFLKEVGLANDDNFLSRNIQTLSGGELQKISIARALVMNPKLLIADEITSMIDPSGKANIIRSLKGLQNKYGFSMIFITHDLMLAQKITDYVYVLKEGKIIEEGYNKNIFMSPQHEYTKKLINTLNMGM